MQKRFGLVSKPRGPVVPFASVLVKTDPGAVVAAIYSDDGVTPLANPLTCDEYGQYAYYAEDGLYSEQVSGPGIGTVVQYGILLNSGSSSAGVVSLSTALSTTNSGVTSLSTGLSTTNSGVTSLSTGLSTGSSGIISLSTGLSTTNSGLASLSTSTSTSVSSLSTAIDAGGSIALGDLSNVNLSSPSGGDILTFDGGSNWYNATPSPSVTQSAGIWTPTLRGSSTSGAVTYTVQDGYYTKVGNIGTFYANITWTAHTGTGDLEMDNCPFLTNSVNQPCSVLFLTGSHNTKPGVVGLLNGTTTKFALPVSGTGTTYLAVVASGSVAITGTFTTI